MFSYKVKDINIGLLGTLTVDEDGLSYRIKSMNKYIAFKDIKKNESSSYEGNYGIDIVTGKKYFIYQDKTYLPHVLNEISGTIVVMQKIPIDAIKKCKSKRISKKEIVSLVDTTNDVMDKYQQIKNKPKDEIKDSILKTILETTLLVKSSYIDQDIKEKTISKLEQLAENYVKDMDSYSKSSALSPFESDYEIRIHYIRELANIEQILTDPRSKKVQTLRKELDHFKRKINSE